MLKASHIKCHNYIPSLRIELDNCRQNTQAIKHNNKKLKNDIIEHIT